MRLVLTSAAALIAGGFILGAGTGSATAAPLPSLTYLDVASTAVQQVDWRRRYYRRNGVWPNGPRAAAGDDVVVTADGDVVVVAPLRPSSCGQYHFWNGVACVDARYNDPYLGPK